MVNGELPNPQDRRDPDILVLLSGGIDSCACVDLYRSMDRPLLALHVDYGQAAAAEEWQAAQQVAAHFRVALHRKRLEQSTLKSAGELPGRNAFLVMTAVMERPSSVNAVALGIHAGTHYADCSPAFVEQLNSLLRVGPGRVEVVAPFLEWSKGDILRYCEERQVPIHLTYSCEVGAAVPCGACLSCLDRKEIDARA